MTDFLNDLKLSSANTDPNYLPEGKYPAFVSKLQIKDVPAKGEKPASKALIITYKVSHLDPENQNKVKTEFKSLPELNLDGTYKDEDSTRNAAYLKQRLLSLGVPEQELDNMKQEDLLGTPVWITMVPTGDYMNIRGVELREEESSTGQL